MAYLYGHNDTAPLPSFLTVNPEDAKQYLTVITAMAIESWSAFATVAINEVSAGSVILAGVLGAIVDIYNDTKLAHLLIRFHTSLQRKLNIIRVPTHNERHTDSSVSSVDVHKYIEKIRIKRGEQ